MLNPKMNKVILIDHRKQRGISSPERQGSKPLPPFITSSSRTTSSQLYYLTVGFEVV